MFAFEGMLQGAKECFAVCFGGVWYPEDVGRHVYRVKRVYASGNGWVLWSA